MVNKLVMAVIAIVVGLALTPVVGGFADNLTVAPVTDTLGTTVETAGQYYNTTTGSLINLLPVLFVIILVAGAVGFVILSKKN